MLRVLTINIPEQVYKSVNLYFGTKKGFDQPVYCNRGFVRDPSSLGSHVQGR